MVDFRINKTLQTGAVRKPHLPAPIISLPRFIGGIETEGRKCLFIFRIHHSIAITASIARVPNCAYVLTITGTL